MSSFDPSTNTPSASFSDAFNCVVMEPATTIQRAYGYQRNNSRRYCEFKINDAGGDPANLWLGMAFYPYAGDTGPETAVLYGGASQNVNVSGGQLPSSVPPSNNAFGTISSGQIWQFHVDFGGGTDQDGVQQVFTITDGLGNIFLPICGSFAVNGTWHTTILGPWICAARGFTGHLRPVVMREDHSTSAASVALRVTTASFSLTIPTGAIAWGSGSGQSSIAYKETKWDQKPASLTYSESQHLVQLPTGAASQAVIAKSNAKRKEGKLYIEFTARDASGTYVDSIELPGAGGGPHPRLIDYRATLTASSTLATAAIAPSGAGPFVQVNRNVTISASNSMAESTPIWGIYVDFDNSKAILSGAAKYYGTQLAVTLVGGDFSTRDKAYPVTISVSLIPYLNRNANTAAPSAQYEINGGHTRFNTPFYPGWTSWDGTRFNTIGVGSTWDTDWLSQSISYMNGNYTFYAFNGANVRVARAQGVNSSGKRYFEFYSHETKLPAGMQLGLMQQAQLDSNSATFSDRTAGTILMGQVSSESFLRQNGITISATGSCTLSIGYNIAGIPLCVAVNFDTGKAWFGNWNRGTRTHDWRGGDPAAGIGEHASFTASSTWHAIAGIQTGTDVRMTGIFTSAGLVGSLPSGYTAWDGTTGDSSNTDTGTSTTATSTASSTSSGTTTGSSGSGGLRVLWPYGVQT